ncbi:unnamed protein product [Chondrus crispus]|uniref:Proteasome subunit alpha type n=1 Tax=Chondrus crispus TaxID=2769 RepID=R7QJH5_CHOCR|nr:unnamed protein product [Chondrus crispus]CDF37550.1 unnamed protein product [Chondrus crispus]|eukprot:XP_005717421.1 unnamed protein product [Chondrus crispus]
MASIGTGYDLSSTTFSPDGRVFQVEYAAKAVENSGTCVGLRCTDGVVLAVEKAVISKMLVQGTLRRSHIVARHATLTVCGLISDGRVIVDHARAEAEQYKDFYGRPIPGHVLADRIAHFVHVYTLHWHVRPFGCAVLLGVADVDGPQLYLIEPSGLSYRYYACAFGKAKAAARTELEKLKLNGSDGKALISCDEGVKELAKILVKVHDESKDKDTELEMITVTDGKDGGAKLVPRKVVEEAHAAAKAFLEADDMED